MSNTNRKIYLPYALLITLAPVFLAGCGQKGDLYLPEEPPAAKKQPAAAKPEPQGSTQAQ